MPIEVRVYRIDRIPSDRRSTLNVSHRAIQFTANLTFGRSVTFNAIIECDHRMGYEGSEARERGTKGGEYAVGPTHRTLPPPSVHHPR